MKRVSKPKVQNTVVSQIPLVYSDKCAVGNTSDINRIVESYAYRTWIETCENRAQYFNLSLVGTALEGYFKASVSIDSDLGLPFVKVERLVSVLRYKNRVKTYGATHLYLPGISYSVLLSEKHIQPTVCHYNGIQYECVILSETGDQYLLKVIGECKLILAVKTSDNYEGSLTEIFDPHSWTAYLQAKDKLIKHIQG